MGTKVSDYKSNLSFSSLRMEQLGENKKTGNKTFRFYVHFTKQESGQKEPTLRDQMEIIRITTTTEEKALEMIETLAQQFKDYSDKDYDKTMNASLNKKTVFHFYIDQKDKRPKWKMGRGCSDRLILYCPTTAGTDIRRMNEKRVKIMEGKFKDIVNTYDIRKLANILRKDAKNRKEELMEKTPKSTEIKFEE